MITDDFYNLVDAISPKETNREQLGDRRVSANGKHFC